MQTDSFFGARPENGAVRFRVWAPGHERVDVVLYGPDAPRLQPLDAEHDGFFGARVDGAGPGSRYKFRFDGGDTFPDPASRSQPDGVHEPSEVIDPAAYRWGDEGWKGLPLDEMVIYELHVGTFTEEGTFAAAIPRLDDLKELGITAVQVMPVAEFPGDRNWGYDGVFLYAPARAYGGAEGMKRFVDAAHQRGMAVLLDVVYNHFGPEGNYLPAITSGRIFNEAHHTPWGAAINYDGEQSGPVREFVAQNALHWILEYHLDGLRLDATHAIIDTSPTHILQEIGERVRAAAGPERHVVLIAEDERNERRLITPIEEGGLGLDGVWADDFHHQLRRLAAGDSEGYFANYMGTAEDVVATLQKGWFYEGQLYPSHDAPRGTPAAGLPQQRFVHTLQNHDQIGNRALGERLHHQVELPVWRAASALLLLSPYTPLLFMGQEWAASTPFLYFTDHPEELGKLVTKGRREEFKGFSAFNDPEQRERIPDPQDPRTFRSSTLRWAEREEPPHSAVLELYRELLRLRRSHPALRERGRDVFRAEPAGPSGVVLRRRATTGQQLVVVCAFDGPVSVILAEGDEVSASGARVLLWTEDERFGGAGQRPDIDGGTLRLPTSGAAVVELG